MKNSAENSLLILKIPMMWYNRKGTVYEFYDSENKIPPF